MCRYAHHNDEPPNGGFVSENGPDPPFLRLKLEELESPMVDDEAGDMSDEPGPQMDPLMAEELGACDQGPVLLDCTNEGSELRKPLDIELPPDAPLAEVLAPEDNGLSGEPGWPDKTKLGGELRIDCWPGAAKVGEFKLMG